MSDIKMAFADGENSGAITNDNKLYLWGSCENGKIGNGTKNGSQLIPFEVMSNVKTALLSEPILGHPNAKSVSSAVTKTGDLYLWGEVLSVTTKPVKVDFSKAVYPSDTTVKGSQSVSDGSLQENGGGMKTSGPQTVVSYWNGSSFTNLIPNSIYNYYVMNDKEASAPFSAENLLYIGQGTSDGTGTLTPVILPMEENANAVIFVVAMGKTDISTASVEAENLTADGSEQFAKVTVTCQGSILAEGEDYELSGDYVVTEPGSYTVKVNGIGFYKGSVEVSYTVKNPENTENPGNPENPSCGHSKTKETIIPATLTEDGIIERKCSVCGEVIGKKSISHPEQFVLTEQVSYNGTEQRPEVTVKDAEGTVISRENYKVTYSNNVNAGNAEVSVTFQKNYSGTKRLSFVITGKAVSELTYSELGDYFAAGTSVEPEVTVTDGEKVLSKGRDYTVSYVNNQKVGTGTIKVTGMGNYVGTKELNFKMTKKVSGVKAESTSYTTAKITWKKLNGVTGYKVYRATSKKGKYKLVKTIKKASTDSMTDKKLTTGKTYYYKVLPYQKAGKNTINGSDSAIVKAKIVPSEPILVSVKNSAAKKAVIKWKKVSGASGYEIYRATSKNGKYKKVKVITKGKTVSYTDSKLAKGKSYYYKIRAYRTVKGKKVYSSYSDVKEIKIVK